MTPGKRSIESEFVEGGAMPLILGIVNETGAASAEGIGEVQLLKDTDNVRGYVIHVNGAWFVSIDTKLLFKGKPSLRSIQALNNLFFKNSTKENVSKFEKQVSKDFAELETFTLEELKQQPEIKVATPVKMRTSSVSGVEMNVNVQLNTRNNEVILL